MTINSDGQASPLPVSHWRHAYWRQRFVHLLAECEHRFGTYPNGFGNEFTDGLKFPDPRSSKVQAARAAVDPSRFEDGKYLVKYGRRDHLEAMLETGTIRIAPASSFNNPSFNDAVRDTELEFSFHLHHPTEEDVRPYTEGLAVNPELLEGAAIVTETAREDFHIFCLAGTYDVRLFDDFTADSCLVITDPVTFRDRLLWTVHHELGARGHTFSAVRYVDPLTETGKGVHFALRKNAYFSYQYEVRAVWLAKDPSAPASVRFVSLGSLRDIAHLVCLT